jgi:hypothetical protein
MTSAKWIIDQSMSDEYIKTSLIEIIKECGKEVALMDYVPFYRKEDLKYPFDMDDCVIPYSTINLGKYLKGYYGSYLDEEELRFHNYFSKLKIDADLWLNGNFVLTTYYDFEQNFQKFVELFGTENLFIRPNSGSKLFTGVPIHGLNDLKYQSNCLRQLSGVMDNSLILVSTSKGIKNEFRFIIVGDKVIDGSQYLSDGVHDQKHFYTQDALKLAEKVAKCKEKPVEIFTCDIATMYDKSVKIVEINSFNCAGWYHCDPRKIVKEVSEYVEKRYKEDME